MYGGINVNISVLLIDNGNDGIDNYVRLLAGCDIKVVKWDHIQDCNVDNYELIVLSHGREISVYRNDLEKNLILSANIPIIGVCYGFQMLSYTYGLKIEELDPPSIGTNKIIAKSQHAMFRGISQFTSIEKHKYGVKTIGTNEKVICHAVSDFGIEIIEILNRKQYGFQFHPEILDQDNQGNIIFNNLLAYLFPNR